MGDIVRGWTPPEAYRQLKERTGLVEPGVKYPSGTKSPLLYRQSSPVQSQSSNV